MCRNDHLQLPCWTVITSAAQRRFFSLLFKKTQDRRLELRMEMSFGLLHQEECQVGVGHLLQFNRNGGYVKQVRVAVTGVTQIFWFDSVVRELEPQVACDVDEGFICAEAQRRDLTANACCQGREANVYGSADVLKNLLVG